MARILMGFPGGKHKVLTISYDDGKSADRRLVDILNRNGLKGTFHINSEMLGIGDRLTAEEVGSLYKGHEVSTHTLTHPTIARSPREQLVHEIFQDRNNLEQIVGYTVRGLSYPNGSYNQRIKDLLPHLGIEYARITGSTNDFAIPDDLYEWKATCHHNHNLLELTDKFLGINKKQNLYMMYVWGHSYEFDNDNNWDLIEEFSARIANQQDIWYATNIEIVDYMNAFRNLKFSAASDRVYNPSACSVWILVDDQIIEILGGSTVKL